MLDPRKFVLPLLTAACLSGPAIGWGQDKSLDFISGNDSATEKYRLVWCNEPTTEVTVGWNQLEGKPAEVFYGTTDFQRHHDKYPMKKSVDRVQDFHGMKNCFAVLTGLKPNTDYYLVVRDEKGVGRRLKFRTAPDKSQSFTFVAGGDSRNGRSARQAGNQIVAKLKPLFVAFTGDMISRDNETCWRDWLDDWQLTIDQEGFMAPIIPHRGNHESKPDSICNLFNTPRDAYFAMNIGADLLRYYALNSMLPAMGKQGQWLERDLKQHSNKTTHLVAGYHKPMRPHVKSKSEGKEPYKWSKLFYEHGVDLAIESDSHVMKRTKPLKPDAKGAEGFSVAENDKRATVYIGEGCWGAPLRPADDAKPWTLDCDRFNGLDWIYVQPDKIEIKTVKFENSAKMKSVASRNSFVDPENTSLWKANSGVILEVEGDR